MEHDTPLHGRENQGDGQAKVLLATDAFSIPEIFWLGARHALSVIASRGFVEDGAREAIARRLLWDNVAAIYGGPRRRSGAARE